LQIIWREKAEIDVREILEFIAQDNVAAAYKIYDILKNKVAMLGEYPEMGRVWRVSGTRELIITRTPYIVAYRIKDNDIQILRVLHGSQKWNK